MSAPTYDEMEAKRQNVSPLAPVASRATAYSAQMIVSFRDVAAAMTRCVAVIEDYVRSTPADAPSATTRLASADIADRKERKKRRKQAKGPRDPNAPKRPPSAYILYQNQVRDAIRTKYPDVPYKEILGQIAEGWRHLSDVQKKVSRAGWSNAEQTTDRLFSPTKSRTSMPTRSSGKQTRHTRPLSACPSQRPPPRRTMRTRAASRSPTRTQS